MCIKCCTIDPVTLYCWVGRSAFDSLAGKKRTFLSPAPLLEIVIESMGRAVEVLGAQINNFTEIPNGNLKNVHSNPSVGEQYGSRRISQRLPYKPAR